MHKFSSRSKQQLATCHPDLQLIAETAIKISKVDWGIHEGYRSQEDQIRYFNSGKSSVRTSKHNLDPAMAFDFHVSEKIHDNPLTWDEEHLTYVGATLMAVADILYQEGKIIHKLRWGGNWDQDGVILKDQKLWDRPHVELVKP